MILHNAFGLMWTTPWPTEKKIKILKNSQFAKFAKFRMKTQLFPRHALPKLFLLYTLITLVILHTAFGLIWTTPWPAGKKNQILKNSQFAKFAKFRMKTQLFPRRAQPIFFRLLLSLHWWYSIPRLVWCGQLLDPLKKKLKFSKIRKSRNSQNSVRKPNFFPRQALPIFFCFTLSLHWWYSIPRLVWFGQLLDPLKKKLKFSIIRNSRNSQNSVWKPNFFLGALN